MQRNLIFNLILILLVIVFAVQNYEPVNIRLYFWDVEVSKAFLVVLVLLIGVLLGVFTSSTASSRKKKKNAEDTGTTDISEKEEE